MSHKSFGILLFLIFMSVKSFCQTSGTAYFITVNGNLYVPRDNPAKGIYPILWYDKETQPKVLVGGLGVGLAALRPLQEKMQLKGGVNFSKHTYWDEPILQVDHSGYEMSTFIAGSSDLTLGLTATVHYALSQRFSVGSGLGSQVLLATLSRLPDFDRPKEGSVAVQHYYKPLMPTLPVELSFKHNEHLFNLRYEHGLLNRYKKELAVYKKDKFGLLFFEVGFKLK